MKTTLQTVEEKVTQGNQWYTDDQYQNQLGAPGARWSLEGRWRLFGKAIDKWINSSDETPMSIRVLDAGCGDGINGRVLSSLLEEQEIRNEIIGCDYNSIRLDRAKRGPYKLLVPADLLQLPFEDSHFDLILCSHVLEHIPQDEACLRELGRVLKPNGLLILAVPNEGCLLAKLRNNIFHRKILRTTDHVNFYKATKLMALVQRIGLKPIDNVMHEGFFLPHLGISTRLRGYSWGRRMLELAAILFPSQSAGLVCGSVKH